jgi:hypothetical protein
VVYACGVWVLGVAAHNCGTHLCFTQAITDIVDGGRPTPDEFYANLHTASEALQQKLTQVVAELGHTDLGARAFIDSAPARLAVVLNGEDAGVERVASVPLPRRAQPTAATTGGSWLTYVLQQVPLVALGALLAVGVMRIPRPKT